MHLPEEQGNAERYRELAPSLSGEVGESQQTVNLFLRVSRFESYLLDHIARWRSSYAGACKTSLGRCKSDTCVQP